MLNQLIDRSTAYDARKRDLGPRRVNEWAFMSMDKQLVLGDHQTASTYPLTDHAFNQVCGRLGAAAWPGSSRSLPVEYLRACPPVLQSDQFAHWMGLLPENREWFVRTYDGAVRAVLTNRYSVVDCTEVLRWVQQIMDDRSDGGDPTYIRPWVNAHQLCLKVILKDVTLPGPGPAGGQPWGVGVYVATGEVGNRAIEVCPLVQNNACANSIWMRHDGHWRHTHTGNAQLLRQAFLVHLLEAFQGTERLLQRLLAAETARLPSFDEILDDMCERHAWSRSTRDNIVRGTDRQNTVYGLTQGISYAAQQVDPAAGDEMEAVAGEWLHHMTKAAVPDAVV